MMNAIPVVVACAFLAADRGATSRPAELGGHTCPITVQFFKGLDGVCPVTGGVPIAEAAVPNGAVFELRDEGGKAVPLQTSVLARWKDGSARWVLLDFQSKRSGDDPRRYTLSWSKGSQAAGPEAIICENVSERPMLKTGNVSVSTADKALLRISDRLDVVATLTDAEGQVCQVVVEKAEVEKPGKLRCTLSLVGSFRRPTGERVFQFRLRASVYAGLSRIRLEPLIVVDSDKGVMQKIRELKLTLRPQAAAQTVAFGGEPGWKGPATSSVRLFQYDDQNYRVEGGERKGGKAPGWAELGDGRGTVAVALRDFWQQWPKSLEVADGALSVGLFPRFKAGDYAHMEPWYKHQYLFDGECYRLRTGQARRWDIWLDLGGNGPALALAANAPPVPAADPARAIATGVWGAIAPAGIPAMAKYDPWAENLFDAYCRAIEVERDYGAMNWGDWFGERVANWGNNEYDTANQILIQFARTGDPRYLYAADAAARHSSEVDTVHFVNEDLAKYVGSGPTGYPPRPGMVHQHTVGHVSGFYGAERIKELFIQKNVDGKNPYLCLDPFNLGHIWTLGMARQYLLTGDPFLRETVEMIGDNLAKLAEDRKFKFMGHSHCGRTTGWSLLALTGAYEIGLNERYLNAMRLLVNDALAEQDSVCGGWLYSLPRGHCNCEKAKHVGMAGFITSILINGLSQYYFLTGDERLPKAVDRAVTFLNNDTWREEWKDWRYTSCPATTHMGQMGVIVLAQINAVRMTNNPEHRRILEVAWDTKFRRLLEAPKPHPGAGKEYTATMSGCAEAAGLLAGSQSGK